MKGSRTVASVDLMKDSRKLLPNESQHTLLLYKNELLKSVTAVKMFFYMYTECMDVINTPPPTHTHTLRASIPPWALIMPSSLTTLACFEVRRVHENKHVTGGRGSTMENVPI